MLIEELLHNSPTPLQKIEDKIFDSAGVNLFIKRLDLIHPEISGNKWYKLKYNLAEAKRKNYDTILTFGGAFSNHIYSTAAAGKLLGFKTIGIIRGEERLSLNPTLEFAEQCGMRIHYLDRNSYKIKNSKEAISSLKEKFGKFYLIPEGGSNLFAVKGCAEIIGEIEMNFDYICTACGTGGTLAGLISALNENQYALGFAVLKGADFLNENVNSLLKNFYTKLKNNWQIIFDYHFGGYAKINSELLEFIFSFESRHSIKLEPIYSGKMLFGIYDLIRKGFFPKDSKIIDLHNGGMQGLNGLRKNQTLGKFEKS